MNWTGPNVYIVYTNEYGGKSVSMYLVGLHWSSLPFGNDWIFRIHIVALSII